MPEGRECSRPFLSLRKNANTAPHGGKSTTKAGEADNGGKGRCGLKSAEEENTGRSPLPHSARKRRETRDVGGERRCSCRCAIRSPAEKRRVPCRLSGKSLTQTRPHTRRASPPRRFPPAKKRRPPRRRERRSLRGALRPLPCRRRKTSPVTATPYRI